MSEKKSTPIPNQLQIDEYHKLEIEEIFTAVRGFTNLRAQVFSFMGTANLTALGFAFSSRQAGLFLVGAGISLITVIADTFVRRHQNALYYRGIQLETRYSRQGEVALLSTYIAVSLGERNLANLKAIVNFRDQHTRIQALRQARSSVFGFWLPIIMALVELGIGIFLWVRLGWKLY